MSFTPTPVDPEVAALTFRRDLDRFWEGGRPEELGWGRRELDPLTELIDVLRFLKSAAQPAEFRR